MSNPLQTLKTLLVRAYAKSLSISSGLMLSNEQQKLQLLVESLNTKAPRLADKKNLENFALLIIIPFKDKWQLTEKCIASLLQQNIMGQRVKVVLVNNNSLEPETLTHLAQWQTKLKEGGFEVEALEDHAPFNFSQLNNRAVERCGSAFQADLLLFLNNDVEFTEPQQLSHWCLWHRAHENVGVSGATLLYPNRTIQHACVLPGFKIVATHPLRNACEAVATEWNANARNVPAVTGAALMVESKHFQELGGFDENLAHACQDVDLCLKALKAGLENWIVPAVTLIHHESATRKSAHKPSEVLYFYARWEEELDALCKVSKKLSRWTESPAHTWGEGLFPWRLFL